MGRREAVAVHGAVGHHVGERSRAAPSSAQAADRDRRRRWRRRSRSRRRCRRAAALDRIGRRRRVGGALQRVRRQQLARPSSSSSALAHAARREQARQQVGTPACSRAHTRARRHLAARDDRGLAAPPAVGRAEGWIGAGAAAPTIMTPPAPARRLAKRSPASVSATGSPRAAAAASAPAAGVERRQACAQAAQSSPSSAGCAGARRPLRFGRLCPASAAAAQPERIHGSRPRVRAPR